VHTSTSFCHRNHFFVFRNEHAQSTTLGPKHICLGWFRVISLLHVVHSEYGCRGAYKHEFLPPEPFLRFSQQTCPIHYFRSKTHVWGGFAQFHCRTSPIPKTGVGVLMNPTGRRVPDLSMRDDGGGKTCWRTTLAARHTRLQGSSKV
jgi:hypothetical protein